ncbi:hypothetical protein RSAG8_13572, partial [Rhizoctonia solani AG-8 WAC10335]
MPYLAREASKNSKKNRKKSMGQDDVKNHDAMQKFNYGSEVYAPLTAQPYELFDAKFRQAFSPILITPLLEMLDHIEINERLQPPQGDANMYTHPLLQVMPSPQVDIESYLRTFRVPEAVYTYSDPDHARHGIMPLYSLVCLDRILVNGHMVFGGGNGAYRVGCCLLALAKLIDDMAHNRIARGPRMLQLSWDGNEGQMLKDIMSEVTNSVKIGFLHQPRLVISM